MGGAFADEGHAAVLAPFVEARHSLVVGEAPPALRAETRSANAHTAVTLSTFTAALSATSAGTTSLAALTGSGSPSLSVPSSLALHLDLPVGRHRPIALIRDGCDRHIRTIRCGFRSRENRGRGRVRH